MILLILLFWGSAFIIVWGMVGYRLSLRFLGKILKSRKFIRNYGLKPTVCVMIVAHNEEKVILDKLNNVVDNDYPPEKIEYIITSDYSTDGTNEIVRKFISEHPVLKIKLHETKKHKGKTNAQNEAQKQVSAEILVMTDANAMFERNAISELVAAFTSDDIVYVTGKLSYKNSEDSSTAASESFYWKGDLAQREIESRIKTITGGNGSIYACRNAFYHDFDPIECHDSSMPYYYSLRKLRAIYNPDAIAYEKAGEVDEDEFKRKVRMNRVIFKSLKRSAKSLNVFKYGWFSYFYFGHRTCRYLLWLAHAVMYVASLVLSLKENGLIQAFYGFAFIGQTIFYMVASSHMKKKSKSKWVNLTSYYTMTVLAQWKGVINNMTGKAKPTWEKAETTR